MLITALSPASADVKVSRGRPAWYGGKVAIVDNGVNVLRKGDIEHGDGGERGPVSLPRIAPFRLGEVDVRPATRQVIVGNAQITLEPRVMQVLVTLGQAAGEVVSRDDLIARAWEGRIVGENAIHQAISRLRALAAGPGAASFTIETIAKVGYRLVERRATGEEAQAAAVPTAALEVACAPAPTIPAATAGSAAAAIPRRLVLGSAAATAGLAGLGAWWWGTSDRTARTAPPAAPTAPAPPAEALVAKGREAMGQALAESALQAVAYLRRATELAPQSADAWSARALAHVELLDIMADAAQADWARAAAARALALDPGNAEARVALVLIAPSFRRWTAQERALRAELARHPGTIVAEEELAFIAASTGRCRDAVRGFRATLAREPMRAGPRFEYALALWSTGDLVAARAELDRARTLWPAHSEFWLERFCFLALTGNPGEALAYLGDPDARPVESPRQQPLPIDALAAVARALASPGREHRTAAIGALGEARERGQLGTPFVVVNLAMLGEIDRAFELLEGFYFGGGRPGHWRAAPGPLARRNTAVLFLLPTAPLRADARFGPLLARLGLDDYWRATGTTPDYQR